MSGIYSRVFCGSVFANNYKRTRYSLKHIRWYFGSNLCIICETKFESLPKLFEHCTTTLHQEIVKLHKKTINIVQEHRDFTESSAENTSISGGTGVEEIYNKLRPE